MASQRFLDVKLCLAFFCILFSAQGYSSSQGSTAPAAEVIVSLPPLVDMLERLLPEGVRVSSFLPPNAAPETFDPPPSALMALSKAQIFVAAEVPFEKIWLPRIESHHKSLVIARPFQGLPGPNSKNHAVSHHGSLEHKMVDHGHDHDPHLWLSPAHLITAVKSLSQAIQQNKNLPASWKLGIAQREAQATAHYETTLSQIRDLLGGSQGSGTAFFVYHPSWGLFAETFGLVQVALEDRGHSPGPAAMQSFLSIFKKSRSRVIFAQPQMSTKEVSKAAELAGARVELVDPLAEDLSAEMIRFSHLLKADFDARK